MASNHASCMVMVVSISAFYLPLVLPILSSFNILEEFLPYQTFVEAGEFGKLAVVIFIYNKRTETSEKQFTESFVIVKLCQCC
jgi:hypothetical protein